MSIDSRSVNFWPDASDQAKLERRDRQQQVVLELSRTALEKSASLDDLLEHAVCLVADCLRVDLCKILEIQPGGSVLLLRAGVGWNQGLVGNAVVSTSAESQAGVTLAHNEPIVVDDLESDRRISGPPLLTEHGVRSGISCVIRGRDGNAWGVIGAHTRALRRFHPDECEFLQSIADTLASLFQRKTAEARAQWQERQFRIVVNALPMLIAYITPDHVYRYANQTYRLWLGVSPDDVIGRTLPDVLDAESWQVSRDHVERAFAGEPQIYDNIMTAPDGSKRAVQVSLVPDTAEDGHCYGIFALAFDVTDRRAREEQNHLVAGELNHRVKNMLARVQSIVRQTARRSESLEEFVNGFTPRLRSLGTANELLTHSDWSGADMHDVVSTAAASAGLDETSYVMTGEYIMLRPRAVLALHLVLHEMFTNALKYGALSVPDGRVTVAWECSSTHAESNSASGEGRSLLLRWREDGGPRPAIPKKSGFGSHVIARSVQYDLNGTVELDYERPAGLEATFTFDIVEPTSRLAVV